MCKKNAMIRSGAHRWGDPPQFISTVLRAIVNPFSTIKKEKIIRHACSMVSSHIVDCHRTWKLLPAIPAVVRSVQARQRPEFLFSC